MSEASHYQDRADGRVHEDEEGRPEPFDVSYMVTVTILDEQKYGIPSEAEIRKAVYRGLPDDVSTEDAIYVERV